MPNFFNGAVPPRINVLTLKGSVRPMEGDKKEAERLAEQSHNDTARVREEDDGMCRMQPPDSLPSSIKQGSPVVTQPDLNPPLPTFRPRAEASEASSLKGALWASGFLDHGNTSASSLKLGGQDCTCACLVCKPSFSVFSGVKRQGIKTDNVELQSKQGAIIRDSSRSSVALPKGRVRGDEGSDQLLWGEASMIAVITKLASA